MERIEALFDEMIEAQEKKLLECAVAIAPQVTADDILQPNDYPELENHPFFRYEEGALKGLYAAKMALRALGALPSFDNGELPPSTEAVCHPSFEKDDARFHPVKEGEGATHLKAEDGVEVAIDES